MKEKLKSLLISLLFRLLDTTGGSDISADDKEIARWLAWSAQDIGFIRYCQARERQLIRGLLLDGLLAAPRDSFMRATGQRFELHAFLAKANSAKEKVKTKRLEKEKQES